MYICVFMHDSTYILTHAPDNNPRDSSTMSTGKLYVKWFVKKSIKHCSASDWKL